MRDYRADTYGESFADVYDEWYATITDVEGTVATIAALAAELPGGRVLELGVGTGRLAIPLARRGFEVVGIDSSASMLERLAAKPGGSLVTAVQGDMAADLPPGPFAVVFVAYNTFFNLLDEQSQRAAFSAVAERLAPGGCFVVEAFVPDDPPRSGSAVEVRDLATDRVVLSVSRADAAQQRIEGQYIELTEAGGVRLRPWAVRWATPEQLDEMAAAAGLALERRSATWRDEPFGDDSAGHVSIYRG